MSIKNLAGRSGFWSGVESKQLLDRQLAESQLLRALWNKQNSPRINAVTTLPAHLESKAEIYSSVQKNTDSKGMVLSAKQFVEFTKRMIAFYKKGVSNVWQNNKTMKSLKKSQFKLSNHVDKNGKDTDVILPRFQSLSAEMAQILYQNRIENQALNSQTQGEVIKNGQKNTTVDSEIFALHRDQFQLLRRTPGDFMKIPAFVVIFSIFMEMTPLVCLAFPEVTPSTCALPSILPRLWNAKANRRVQDHTKGLLSESDLPTIASKTAYNLPVIAVRDLAKTLRLVSKYVPSSFYPEPVLRRRLQGYFNYITVDNYYLSGLNGDGNVWDLTRAELLSACLERNLILDLKQETAIFNDEKDAAKKGDLEAAYLNCLRARLVRFIADFESFNVGYVALNGLLPAVEIVHDDLKISTSWPHS